MSRPPKPDNEEQRLAALRSFDILDSEPERAFDDLVRIAAGICGVPMAPATEATPATAAADEDLRLSAPIVSRTSCSTPRSAESRNSPWGVVCALAGLGVWRRLRRMH